MEFNLCIPTLNRYDLLIKTLLTAESGTLKPAAYYIIFVCSPKILKYASGIPVIITWSPKEPQRCNIIFLDNYSNKGVRVVSRTCLYVLNIAY